MKKHSMQEAASERARKVQQWETDEQEAKHLYKLIRKANNGADAIIELFEFTANDSSLAGAHNESMESCAEYLTEAGVLESLVRLAPADFLLGYRMRLDAENRAVLDAALKGHSAVSRG